MMFRSLLGWLVIVFPLLAHVNFLTAAPIVVETRDPAPLPVTPGIPEGVTLDFEYQAVSEFGPPKDKAVELLLKKLGIKSSGGPQSVTAAESVIVNTNVLSHPSLYVSNTGLHPDERVPKDWNGYFLPRGARIRQVIRSVGRVEVYGSDLLTSEFGSIKIPAHAPCAIVGTCFVVTPGVVMTNAHVANLFTSEDGSFKLGRGMVPLVVRVNFAGGNEDEPILFRVTKVLYNCSQRNPVDAALLQVDNLGVGPQLPDPIPLQTITPNNIDVNRRLFACGFPTNAGEQYHLFRTVRVKRLSLGQLVGHKYFENEDRFCLFHNCTTLGGSSGSPLVDFDNGTVWGLHFAGDELGQANKAELMWKICEIPAVQKILGTAATKAPTLLAPLAIQPPPPPPSKSTRPSAFASRDRIHQKTLDQLPPEWQKHFKGAEKVINGSLPSVGKISVEKPDETHLSTGFMIAPGIVATAGYALDRYLNTDLSFRNGPDGKKTSLWIDFASTAFNDKAERFQVGEVLYLEKGDLNSRYALLRLVKRDDIPFPPPLPLQRDPIDATRRDMVLAITYPAVDGRIPSEVFNTIFPPPYGVKRVAPGFLMQPKFEDDPAKEFFHDCSTSGGDGGAPLISVSTGKVLGIHLGGLYRVRNFAVPMSFVLRDPALRNIEALRSLYQ
jgi:hypothetical protein